MKEFLYENGPLDAALNTNPLQTYIKNIKIFVFKIENNKPKENRKISNIILEK